MINELHLEPDDALLLVDVQVDFCPGGALPVKEGDRIVPVVNQWIARFSESGLPVFASRDWHPEHHLSFEQEGGPWPRHCIQNTPGAGFHKDLQLPKSTTVITKGVRFDQDQNSAFDQTGLEVQLRRKGIRRLIIAGLALDVCVLATAMDARKNGFDAVLIADATRPVDAENGRKALTRMREEGVKILKNPQPSAPAAGEAEGEEAAAEQDVCLKAPEWAEHQRFNDFDIPCDDGRSG
jgi:nicotinamidase/pyrazinamidase